MRRALLVLNPRATAVSPRVRDVIARALSSAIGLEVVETKRRHHATHLAAGAAHEGFDLVIVLAGDGTVNEAINGLAGTGIPLAPLPGGSTNVFARTLGLPRDAIEATSVLLERIASGTSPRNVTVGRVDGRYFGFCAGVGFDAALVRAVERTFALKQKVGQPLFVAQGLRTFFVGYGRATASIEMTVGRATYTGLKTVVVCNSSPYTFLGDHPVRLCPDASLDRGLDVLAVDALPVARTLRVLARAFRDGDHARLRGVHLLHDLDELRISTLAPLPYQVDGDDAGDAHELTFTAVRDGLLVLA